MEQLKELSNLLGDVSGLQKSERTQTESILNRLEGDRELKGRISDDTSGILRKLHSAVISVLQRLEESVRFDIESDNCRNAAALLELLLKLLPFLPKRLLERVSTVIAEDAPRPSFVTELDDQTVLNPIGVDVLLTVALFPRGNSTLSVLHCLAEALGLAPSRCIVYFLEDIRSRLLPKWKSFHTSQTDNADFTCSAPSFQERMLEACRLHGVFKLLTETTLSDHVMDRLLPCALFVVDDFDPRVASVGAQTLQCVIASATKQGIKNWRHVLLSTLSDRILSSDVTLFRELLPVAITFCQRSDTSSKETEDTSLSIFDKILERLSTDLAPFEIGQVFLNHAAMLMRHLGLKTVRFFSRLSPLLVQWLLSNLPSVQIKALDLLMEIAKATAPRIPRHEQIIRDVLEAMEVNPSTAGNALKAKIREAQTCLDKVIGTCVCKSDNTE